jgi:hypothetical protein
MFPLFLWAAARCTSRLQQNNLSVKMAACVLHSDALNNRPVVLVFVAPLFIVPLKKLIIILGFAFFIFAIVTVAPIITFYLLHVSA